MLLPRIHNPSNYPSVVGKLRPEQIAARTSWAGVPDSQTTLAALHIIHIAPRRASTETRLNPLDPGTVGETEPGDWFDTPGAWGALYPARFAR